MANTNQIAVKKRLIYAEDLFAPVDFKVFMGGRSCGKTMAMYEQIFRQRVEMAPTIDAVEVVRCNNCRYFECDENDHLGLCKNGAIATNYGGEIYPERSFFCAYGKRRD